MKQPCKGLRVIELANVLAGPSVGQFFAELGATVLKIEHPGTHGDVTRSWKLPSEPRNTSISAYFSAVNWGKESIALHINRPEGRERLYALIAEADIVIASYKPGDAEKLCVDFPTLQKIQPRLIYGAITGYGPNDARAGYDAVIQAEAGFLYMNGQPDGAPTKMPVALVDVLAAHQLKQALLLALWEREKSGEGAYVAVSLFDAALSALSNQATNWLNAGHLPQRMGSEHPNIVPYGTLFPTVDGANVLLAVGTDKQFAALLNVLELPPEARFATNPQRVAHKEALLPLLQERIAQWNSAPLLSALHARHVPAARVNNMAQVFEQPNAQALLLRASNGLSGLRQFVAQSTLFPQAPLTPPPPYAEE